MSVLLDAVTATPIAGETDRFRVRLWRPETPKLFSSSVNGLAYVVATQPERLGEYTLDVSAVDSCREVALTGDAIAEWVATNIPKTYARVRSIIDGGD